ncbi:MAG TPA: MDR family MFS transporter [Candidatus Angelobacter sp.]|nr:MDR family MFS transporter [Candidatus Angelobacter sp.]
MPTGRSTSPAPLSERSRMVILGAVLLVLFLGSLDQTVVGTALPRIVTDLHGSDQYAWVVTIYLLTSTITVPIYGKLSDVYGRKPLLMIGVVLFLIGSALSGLSQSIDQLIVFRAIQGLGAGALFPISLAIVGDMFSPRERGRYQGLFGAVFGVSFLLGPLIGGFFTDHVSWHWIFYVNLPIGILALFVISTVLHNVRRGDTRVRDFDYLGTAVFTAGVVPLLLGLSNKGTTAADGTLPSWGSFGVGGLLLIGVALLALFVYVEARAKEPIVPLTLFRDRTFSASIAATLMVAIGMFSAIIYLPRFYQVVRGVSATQSGYETWPLLVGLIGGSVVAGRLISRTGRYRYLIVASTLFLMVGTGLMTTLTATTNNYVLWAMMLLVGLGVGPGMSGFTTIVQNVVSPRLMGTATSSLTFFRQMGGSIGLALAGTLFNQQFASLLPGKLVDAGVPQSVADGIANSPSRGSLTGVGAAQGAANVVTGVHNAFAAATAEMFWIGVVSGVIAFVAVLFVREVPLRRRDEPQPLGDGAGLPGEEPAVVGAVA